MGNGDGTWAHNFHFLRRGFSWTSGEQQLRAAQEFKSHLAKVGNRWPRLTRPLTAGGDRSEQPHWETLHWGHHRPGDSRNQKALLFPGEGLFLGTCGLVCRGCLVAGLEQIWGTVEGGVGEQV